MLCNLIGSNYELHDLIIHPKRFLEVEKKPIPTPRTLQVFIQLWSTQFREIRLLHDTVGLYFSPFSLSLSDSLTLFIVFRFFQVYSYPIYFISSHLFQINLNIRFRKHFNILCQFNLWHLLLNASSIGFFSCLRCCCCCCYGWWLLMFSTSSTNASILTNIREIL